MPEHDVEAVVIGAGIAGLAMAWPLRHREVVVLERANRVGGRIWSEPRGDYWLNVGAHVFAGPESTTGSQASAGASDAYSSQGAVVICS